jgi:hypothetical protein
MSKRPLDIENKENEEPSQPIPAKKMKTSSEIVSIQQPELPEEEVVEEEEEENKPWPIAAVIEHNEGTIHPKNKQYVVYENTEPSMISKTARFWCRKYLKVLRHVNPDVYDMYIHNDFVCYGELEVIENCLIDMAKGIFLKRKIPMSFTHYITTFRRLEALLIVVDCANNLPMMDDGGRFEEIVRVIGACCVTILHDLLPKSMFNNEELNEDEMRKLIKISHQLPNFKDVIKRAIILGHSLLTIGDTFSSFTNILHIVYCKWLLLIDKIRINLNEKPDEKDESFWKALKHAAGIRKNTYKESFNFMKELSIYSVNNPGLGGNSHDLRKWSPTQRRIYSFDNDDEDSAENFWFRL